MAEQMRVAVPYEQRVAGWLYDHHSGMCMGIASDELKKKQSAGVPFKMALFGCPHTIVIHPAKDVVSTVACDWTYKRSRGDIEVHASTAEEAKRLIVKTGLVKRFDAVKLEKMEIKAPKASIK